MLANKKYYYPFVLLFIYSCVTIFFFLYGPYDYILENGTYLFYFLVAVHISLIGGYVLGQKSNGRRLLLRFSSLKATKYIIVVIVFYKLISIIGTGGGDLFRVSTAIADPAQAYLDGSTKAGNISIFNYIDMVFAPFVTIGVTAGIFFWKRLTLIFKAQLLLYILIVLLSSIGASVRSSIIALIINITCGLMASHMAGNIKITARKKVIICFSFIFFILTFFLYTKNLSENRTTILVNPVTLQSPNNENFFYKILPDDYSITITGISFYLGHSYYRLNQAISLPFNGLGFGLSNSYFLMENIERITGWGGLKSISYGYRLDMELTQKFGVFWTTTYTWLASDLTFPGVVVLLFFIAYWLSISIKDNILDANIFSIAVFSNLFAFIYSLPTVNPLQDGSGLINFFSIFLIWIIFRGRLSEK
jgi:hypothetical protein